MRKRNKIILNILITICLIVFILTSLINIVVVAKSSKYINSQIDYNDYEYILLLGAKVTDNKPSLMLKDRLDKVIEIYNKSKDIKIIVSGDSSNPKDYDEVSVMYNYLISNNIDESNIIRDNYGVSTYDSIYRIQDIVKEKKIIIVTQKYHLYRSIFITHELDIDSVGISAREYKYFGQVGRDIREILARVKDFFLAKLKLEAKYD